MNRKKAQSEIVGVLLILGISFASIGIILLLGQPVLSDATNDATVDRVQNEMVTLDSRLTAVSQGTSENESLSFNLEGGKLTSDSDTTRLNVTLENGDVIYDREIGNIEYENGEAAVAYEAGGVWRRNTLTGGSSMVSSPDFDFDGETLTLPVYNVTTDIGYSGPRTIPVLGGDKTSYFPNATNRNPVDGNVTVTVETEYYQAWGRYFENELRGNATVNETAKEVEAELLALETPDSIDWAGVSKMEYERPSNDPFDGDTKDGVKFPSVDDTIERYVEYGENNIDSPEVEDITACDGVTCDDSGAQVYFNDTDYTMDGEVFDASDSGNGGNVTVVVDGDLTLKKMEVNDGPDPTKLTIVATGDLVMADGYFIDNSSGNADLNNIVFHTKSDSEVVFKGGGGDGVGTVYSPDSLVSLSEMGEGSGSEWAGPIVGKVFDAGGVDSDAQINLGGSSVDVQRAGRSIKMYLTERNVGIG